MKMTIGILAGGSAHGQNHAKVKVNNRLNVRKLTYELSALGEVLISAAAEGDYEDLGCRVIYDRAEGRGPVEGLYNLISCADTEYVFICGADMPMVKRELAEYMSEFISSDYDCYCLTDDDHVHPLCSIYSKAMLPLIEEAIQSGDYKLINIIRRARTKYIKLEFTCFDKNIVKNTIIRKTGDDLRPSVVFCVSGPKNSGKTGLIVKLINEFIDEGYSVGAIKHDGHDYTMDYKGSDTYRFAEAGASRSVIFSGRSFSVNGKGRKNIEYLLKYCSDLDVVIAEGLKNSSYPKIEMISGNQSSLCDSKTLICKTTDSEIPYSEDIPVFSRDDIKGIFLCVKKYFNLE